MLGLLTDESMSKIFSDILSFDEVKESTSDDEEVVLSPEISRFVAFLSETECDNLDQYSFSEILDWLNGLTNRNSILSVDGGMTVYDSIYRDFMKVRSKRRVLL